jgi:SAM-dependent methyltransferase
MPSMLAVERGGAGRAGDLPPAALTPLQRLQESTSGSRFVRLGKQWMSYFVELCDLQPHEHVLDVGCGRGRVAVPLTDYLTAGRYEGFDIDREKVDWCTRHITSRYRNFSFQMADVFSPAYNPSGSRPAAEYEFPFPDGEFDFVFVVTVFNTMLPAAVENYLSESVRVLKDGGRLLATFLLLNDESLRLLSEKYEELPPGIQTLYDGQDHGDHRVARGDSPYAGVTFHEQFVLDLFERVGLRVREPLHYGWWPGRKAAPVAHDFIVADRASRS